MYCIYHVKRRVDLMYTVQDLAKRYKCTRQTIYKKFEDDKLKQYTYKDDKGLKLKQEGLEVLNYLMANSNVNTKKQETNKEIDVKHTVEKVTDNDKYIDSLNRQIEMLSRQVENLQEDKKSLEVDKSRLFEELREQRKLLTSSEVVKIEPRGLFKRIFNLK